MIGLAHTSLSSYFERCHLFKQKFKWSLIEIQSCTPWELLAHEILETEILKRRIND